MSRRIRVRTGILLIASVLMLTTACSSKKATAINGGVPAPDPAVSGLLVPTPDPTLSGQPAADGQTPGTPRSTSTPSAGSTTAPVHVTVTMTKHHDTYTPACPYKDELSASIAVDRPVKLTYQLSHNGNTVTSAIPLNFVTPGSAGADYLLTVPPASFTAIHDEIVVKVADGQTLSDVDVFAVSCIPSAGPVSASPANNVCPYMTTFSVKVSVQVGPQVSTYKWIFEDQSVVTGSVIFSGTGPQSQVVSVKRILQLGSKGVSASFQPNEHASPTTTATATCSF